MERLCLVIDGHSLMHRAFHAVNDLTNEKGVPTNAIYGFAMMLLKLIKDRDPSHAAVAFDLPGATFRHVDYPAYKGTRKPMDPNLRPQFPLVRDFLKALGVAIVEKEGYEADDALGAIATLCKMQGLPCLLVTGDKDALQLVEGDTRVLYTKRGIADTIEFTPDAVEAYMGVPPERVPDLKGLMGDTSDNIPGIAGIGEKTAVALLTRYHTLENALDHADEQKGKLKERLTEGRNVALLSKKLATIDRNAPFEIALSQLVLGDFTGAEMALYALEFASLVPRARQIVAQRSTVVAVPMEAPPERVLSTVEEIRAYAAKTAHAALIIHDDITLSDGVSPIRIPLAKDLLSAGLSLPEALSALGPLLEKQHSLTLWDAKSLLHALEAYGEPLPPDVIAEDVHLLQWLGNPTARLSAPTNAVELQTLFQEAEPSPLYREMELPLARVLLAMERHGFLLDRQVLLTIGEEFTQREMELKAEIHALSGIPFNILSPKQLGEVLFETLRLPTGRKTKSGYSTDADTLDNLIDAHPIVPLVLQYRQVTKLNSTYIDGLLSRIGPDGRVRTVFDQTAVVTGRLSSSEPNLQNIPVRTPMGRKIRGAFIAPPGWILVDADYSQIELRVLAHMSGDVEMQRAFLSGEDIHRHTASLVYGVPDHAVTPEMRSAAKAVNFGIVYGISDFGLAKNIGIARHEAQRFIERYFERFPGVKRFMEQAVEDGKTKGYAETLFGRKRPLPELLNASYSVRSFGERAAMNTPVQGTAADLIKIAMIHVDERLKHEGLSAKLILQVHDELIVECPLPEQTQVETILKEAMEGAATLSVPLQADVKSGRTWLSAH